MGKTFPLPGCATPGQGGRGGRPSYTAGREEPLPGQLRKGTEKKRHLHEPGAREGELCLQAGAGEASAQRWEQGSCSWGSWGDRSLAVGWRPGERRSSCQRPGEVGGIASQLESPRGAFEGETKQQTKLAGSTRPRLSWKRQGVQATIGMVLPHFQFLCMKGTGRRLPHTPDCPSGK